MAGGDIGMALAVVEVAATVPRADSPIRAKVILRIELSIIWERQRSRGDVNLG
jgi:hypothetical protein